MNELIQKLQNIHGLSPEQSHGILNTIKDYIKEKFPMVGGAVDNLFPAGTATSATTSTTAETQASATDVPQGGGDFLDKISDFIPGSTGEKIEEFAKDKLGSFFGEDKRI